MTQGDILARLALGVARDDLAALYPTFVNEALMEIQRRHSWLCMRALGTFTIPRGLTTIAFPANFKELTSGYPSAVHLHGSLETPDFPLVLTPCDVWPRERVIRREGRILGNSILFPNRFERLSIPVWIEWSAEAPSLNIFYPAQMDLTFDVSYFGYLANLASPGDHNLLTDEFPEMVTAKCKAIAFEAINDPAAGDFETLFLARFKDACAKDSYAFVRGTELRM